MLGAGNYVLMLRRILQKSASQPSYRGTTSVNHAYMRTWHRVLTAVMQIVLGIAFCCFFINQTDLVVQLLSGD